MSATIDRSEHPTSGDATSASRSHWTPPTGPLPPEPMPKNLRSTQPGGGTVMTLELLWGRLRRQFHRAFRRGYVDRMTTTRVGDPSGLPHPVHDSRDLKYLRNQTDVHWKPRDDPFRWRDSIPFARWGLAELLVLTGFWLTLCVLFATLIAVSPYAWLTVVLSLLAITCGLFACEMVWFFRDPPRAVPAGAGVLCSPADGTVAEITDVDDPFCGPSVRVGIFLSVFNVHINRVPEAVRVVGVSYKPGKMLNALRPESARENERLELRLQSLADPARCYRLVQITGAIARRIVCDARPGDVYEAGEKFGMIKLGSRTELVLPRVDGLEVSVDVGDKVQAGQTVFARYPAA